MTSKNLRFIFDHPPKQLPTGKKEGKMQIQKFQYLENEEGMLDEIKIIFHNYLKAIIWWKNEK